MQLLMQLLNTKALFVVRQPGEGSKGHIPPLLTSYRVTEKKVIIKNRITFI